MKRRVRKRLVIYLLLIAVAAFLITVIFGWQVALIWVGGSAFASVFTVTLAVLFSLGFAWCQGAQLSVNRIGDMLWS